MKREEATKMALKRFPRDFRYQKTEGDFERIDINEPDRERYIQELLKQMENEDDLNYPHK